MAKQAQAHSKKETVVIQLRRDIISGQIQPGSIIRDLELAERYQASTSPVREALMQLASEGLVDMPPNRPKQVSHLDRKTAQDLVAVHCLLAREAYRLGLPKVDHEGLETMRQAMAIIEDHANKGDQLALLAATRQFNDVILKASNNKSLRLLTINTFSSIERIVVMWSLKGYMHAEDLRSVLNDMEAGKPEAALQSFEKLLSQFEQDVAELAPHF